MKTKYWRPVKITAILLGLVGLSAVNYVSAAQVIEEDGTQVSGVVSYGDVNDVRLFQEIPTANAVRTGMWSSVGNWPLFAIHTAVLPDGRVLTYGTDLSGRGHGFAYDIWNPINGLSSGAHQLLPVTTQTNIFCSSQILLSDGRLLITGGDQKPIGTGGSGIREANVFEPATGSLSLTGSMSSDRWYPASTVLPDGRVLIQGGRIDKSTPATMPEVYDAARGMFTPLSGADSASVYAQDTKGWYYPRSFVNNAGNVIFFTANQTQLFELNPTANANHGELRSLGGMGANPFRYYYPAVEFTPGKVLTFRDGGISNIIDINTFTKESAANINVQRIWSNATLLADGRVLVTGGASERQNLATAVTQAQIYDSRTNAWSNGAKAARARLYHSSAVLLPSGAVLTAGGGPPGPIQQLNAEIYYPSYLFNASGGWAVRPSLSAVTKNMSYDQDFTLTVTHNRTITGVNMVRLGSATHSFDMGQSFRTVPFQLSGSTLTLPIAGHNSRSMTPGHYMIFALDDLGVPSEAMIVSLS